LEFELLKNGKVAQAKQVASFTAFVMAFDDVPVLVTAGHVIRDSLEPMIIQNKYKGLDVRVGQMTLCDFFGPREDVKSWNPTPFPDYASRPRWALDDKSLKENGNGLDFGVIMLPRFTWESMRGNGVKIISEDMWAKRTSRFEKYKLIGFPSELTVDYSVQLRSLTVTKVPRAKGKTPDGRPAWFVGTVPKEITSVEGMSGGPIFGFRKLENGGLSHRVVAMQSWQSMGQKRVYGTPLTSFGPEIKKVIAMLKKKGNAQKQRESGKKP
jgi:hypothetical protein